MLLCCKANNKSRHWKLKLSSSSKRFIDVQYRYLSKSMFKNQLVSGQEVKWCECIQKVLVNFSCILWQLFGRITTLAKEVFDDWKHRNKNFKKNMETHLKIVCFSYKIMDILLQEKSTHIFQSSLVTNFEKNRYSGLVTSSCLFTF